MFNEALISLPPNLILDGFFDKADALEDVGNIVDSAFLYFEVLGGFIQVDFLRR